MKKMDALSGLARASLPVAIALAVTQPLSASAQVLEEVLVTAERRVESLQDTPISITALTSDAIEKRGITNAEDMFGSIPGMGGATVPGSRGALGMSIRGVSAGGANNISLDPAVGMYVDGVYVGKMLGTAMDVAQIERIEILRGPQGTLYGRNSTAGALNVISRKPLGEFAADVTVGIGNYRARTLKTNIDFDSIGEIGEGAGRLDAAVSFMFKDRDGLYDNYSGGGDFDSLNRRAWRGALRWHLSDSFVVDYAYDYSKLDENGSLQKVVGFTPLTTQGTNRVDFLRNTVLPAAQGFNLNPVADPRIAARWIPSINETIAAYERAEARGEGRPDGGWADDTPTSENESNGHAITAEWNLGELGLLGDVTFKSITAYRDIETYVFGDIDDIDSSLDANGIGAYNDNLHATLLQLYADPSSFGASNPGIDALWGAVDQIGAGHTKQDTLSNYEQVSQELQWLGATQQLDYVLGLYWFGDESKFDRRANFSSPLAGVQAQKYELNTAARAAYTQGTYRFASLSDRLALTVGLRYTEEKKAIDYDFGAVLTPFGLSPAQMANRNNHFYNFSYNATVAYDVTDQLNAFVRYATGYRSGGFNGEVFDNGFEEELMKQLEVGVKSDWFQNRLRVNGSLYAYDYDDMQTSTVSISPGGQATTTIINAGRAERWGGELEVSAAPIENMVVSLGYSYIHGDFEEYPDTCDANTCIEADDLAKRSNSPSNKVNASLDYTFATTSIGAFNLFLDATWQDQWNSIGFVSSVTSDGMGGEEPYQYDLSPMDERLIVNGRLSLRDIPVKQGDLSVSLWVNNITDDDYPTFGINFQSLGLITEQYGPPRTYGLDVRYRF